MSDRSERARHYELWVADLMRSRVGQGVVEHDIRLSGRRGGLRQVDVLVTASYPGLPEPQQMVVEAKAWKRPVSVSEVAKLRDLMDDVGAPLGLLVTPIGFTAGAIRRADELPGITLEV